jgi:putative Mn2+ efflux pump MntP
MDPITVIMLSVGLAMDAFTVSLCTGMAMDPLRVRLAVRMAASFGFFQAGMPVLGWLGGLGLVRFISSYDHWVAFGLLAIVGGKMIYEAGKGEEACRVIDAGNLWVLLVLSVATSIDALAVGFSFALLEMRILGPVITIGVITAALSLAGVILGRRCSTLFRDRVQIVGGLILIGIGVRIVIEHLTVAATALG